MKVWTDDGRMTEASYPISSHRAFGSWELKKGTVRELNISAELAQADRDTLTDA